MQQENGVMGKKRPLFAYAAYDLFPIKEDRFTHLHDRTSNHLIKHIQSKTHSMTTCTLKCLWTISLSILLTSDWIFCLNTWIHVWIVHPTEFDQRSDWMIKNEISRITETKQNIAQSSKVCPKFSPAQPSYSTLPVHCNASQCLILKAFVLFM